MAKQVSVKLYRTSGAYSEYTGIEVQKKTDLMIEFKKVTVTHDGTHITKTISSTLPYTIEETIEHSGAVTL